MDNTDPINRIPNSYSRPSKPWIRLRAHPRSLPPRAPPRMNVIKLRQSADVRAPAKIIDDEARDARGLSGIDHEGLVFDAGGADDADGGVLARECGGQRGEGVGCSDDGEAGGEGRCGVEAGEDGDGEAGAEEGGGDGGAEVARGR